MTTQTITESRICSVCCRQFPRSEFRKRWKNSDTRMPDCRRCHAVNERDRQRRRRQQKNGLTVQKYSSKIARSSKFERISNLIELMAEDLCGPNNFIEFWHTELQRLRSQRKCHTRLLRFMEMVCKAHHVCETAFERWLETASDEEIRDMRQDILRRQFLNDRVLMSAEARQAGCRIVWPEDVKAASFHE